MHMSPTLQKVKSMSFGFLVLIAKNPHLLKDLGPCAIEGDVLVPYQRIRVVR